MVQKPIRNVVLTLADKTVVFQTFLFYIKYLPNTLRTFKINRVLFMDTSGFNLVFFCFYLLKLLDCFSVLFKLGPLQI